MITNPNTHATHVRTRASSAIVGATQPVLDATICGDARTWLREHTDPATPQSIPDHVAALRRATTAVVDSNTRCEQASVINVEVRNFEQTLEDISQACAEAGVS